jgi:predicted aspartyl protease
MNIRSNVKLQGARNEIIVDGLIDTGAEISLLPMSIAARIGVWGINRQINLIGVHGESRTLPMVAARLYFPSLNHIGGQFVFAVSDTNQEIIVGMDILELLGITIDAKTHQLTVKNDIWEAFKTLAAAGALFIGGIKILEALSEQE